MQSSDRTSGTADLRQRILEWNGTYRIITLVTFLTVWEIYARNATSLLIPTVGETAAGIAELAVDSRLWEALAISNVAMVIGFLISLAIGVPLGLALGRFRRAETFANVYLNILLVSPMAVIIPLLIMSTGIGLLSRVLLIVFFCLVYIVINCRAGVRQVDPRLIEMAESFGASEAQTWRRVLLPGAMPAIMAGVRLGLGRAVEGMVIVELLMVAVGVGNLVLIFRGQFEPGLLFGVVFFVVVEGLILITAARRLEHRLTPWVWRTGLR